MPPHLDEYRRAKREQKLLLADSTVQLIVFVAAIREILRREIYREDKENFFAHANTMKIKGERRVEEERSMAGCEFEKFALQIELKFLSAIRSVFLCSLRRFNRRQALAKVRDGAAALCANLRMPSQAGMAELADAADSKSAGA